MSLEDFALIELKSDTLISYFDCDDEDLNDFLISKAKNYSKELLATTFLLEKENSVVAYFSIFNDSLVIEEEDFASKSSLKKLLSSLVSHPKRHLKTFPAVKVGRLAVSKEAKGIGIGRKIINFLIAFCLEHNRNCACKLITVDAYAQSLAFYEKMGFAYLTEKDKESDTRQMYLDLTPYFNADDEFEIYQTPA